MAGWSLCHSVNQDRNGVTLRVVFPVNRSNDPLAGDRVINKATEILFPPINAEIKQQRLHHWGSGLPSHSRSEARCCMAGPGGRQAEAVPPTTSAATAIRPAAPTSEITCGAKSCNPSIELRWPADDGLPSLSARHCHLSQMLEVGGWEKLSRRMRVAYSGRTFLAAVLPPLPCPTS